MSDSHTAFCMICDSVLSDVDRGVVHFSCVPCNQLIVRCNCGELSCFTEPIALAQVIEFYNSCLDEQGDSRRIGSQAGVFLIVSECGACVKEDQDDDFQVIYMYDRRSEYN